VRRAEVAPENYQARFKHWEFACSKVFKLSGRIEAEDIKELREVLLWKQRGSSSFCT
jgi:hypothetical protein